MIKRSSYTSEQDMALIEASKLKCVVGAQVKELRRLAALWGKTTAALHGRMKVVVGGRKYARRTVTRSPRIEAVAEREAVVTAQEQKRGVGISTLTACPTWMKPLTKEQLMGRR